MADKPIEHTALLQDAPKNWGRWGADDELGSLNFLTNEEVLRGVRAVKQGKTFMLGVPVARPQGDPLHPIRSQPIRTQTHDEGFYLSGRSTPFPGGLKYTDDVIVMFPQGTTQYDALGHAWYGDRLYNGYDPKTTIGGLQKCSIEPIANHGVIGRGVLIDAARYKGKKHLDRGEGVTLDDVQGAAKKQGVTIEKHDILVLHTGWLTGSTRRARRPSSPTVSSTNPASNTAKSWCNGSTRWRSPRSAPTPSAANKPTTRRPAGWGYSMPRCSVTS